MKLNSKILLIFILFFIAAVGFLLKLPSSFRYYDKELHALFYFSAAAFLSILFTRQSFAQHILMIMSLLFFGIIIEFLQQYSNRFFHKRIHGRFDPDDVKYNIIGLLIFSAIWISYRACRFFYKRIW